MTSILPHLRRPQSARRYIPPPSPKSAAIYQRNFMRESSRSTRRTNTRSAEFKIEEIDDFIQRETYQIKGEFQRFKIYQQAFDLLIQKYDRHNEEMKLVKNGYDSIIKELMDSNSLHNRSRLAVQQSLTSLNNSLQVKQAKFDKKKQGFQNLIESVETLNSSLTQELIELKDQLIKETMQLKILQSAANESQHSLDTLNSKLKKKKDLKSTYLTAIKNNTIKREQLEEEAKTSEMQLSAVLDSICNSNREIAATRIRINDLDEEISRMNHKIQQKEDLLMSYSEEKQSLSEEIIEINKSAQEIRDCNASFTFKLIRLLKNSGIKSRTLSMIGEDPIKLVALAISKKKGFEDGIDPELFPNL